VAGLADVAKEGLVGGKGRAQVIGKLVEQPEAGVVAGTFVVGAGISQANDRRIGSGMIQTVSCGR